VDTDLKSLFSDGELSEVEKAQANDFYTQWVQTERAKNITRPSTMSATSIETYLFAMQNDLTDEQWALLTGTSSDTYPTYTDPENYIDKLIKTNDKGGKVVSLNNPSVSGKQGETLDDYLALKLFGANIHLENSTIYGVYYKDGYVLSKEQQQQLEAAKDIIYNHFGDDVETVPVDEFKSLMARLSSFSYQQGSPSIF
jgi:hypothetical protein